MQWLGFSFFIVVFCALRELIASSNFEALSRDTLQAQYGIIEYAGLVFRHGDRTPIQLYPTDPHQNYVWLVNLGELTNAGKRREYNLGKYFEPRYNCLTGVPYLPLRVIMDSSNVDRALMSGELFYAGYYPPFGNEIWDERILWQPIPVHTCPTNEDYVISNSKPCPLLDQATQNFYATSPIIRKVCYIYGNLFAYIQKYSGLNLTPCRSAQSIKNLLFFRDTLQTEVESNLTLPEWTIAVYPEPLNFLLGILLEIESEDPIVQRLSAGPLLNVLASDMLNIARLNNTLPQILFTSAPSRTRPLHLFSGHDTTITQLMRALNIYQNVAPPYAAALGFELRSRDNTFYVTVIYEHSLTKPPQILEIPGCGSGCTLNQFLSLVVPLIPTNWEAECNTALPGKPTSIPIPSTEKSTTTFTTWTTWTPPTLIPSANPPPSWSPPEKLSIAVDIPQLDGPIWSEPTVATELFHNTTAVNVEAKFNSSDNSSSEQL